MIPNTCTHFSISQVTAYKRNPFYWALASLFKLPQPESDALRYGKALHLAIENRIKGSPCEAAADIKAAAAAVYARLLKQFYGFEDLKGDIWVEKEFTLKLAEDLPPFKGIIDLVVLNAHKDIPIIIDHKTIKNKRYGLKTHTLKKDPQLSLYAHYLAASIPSAQQGSFVQHNQIFKDSGEIRFIKTFLCSSRIEKNLSDIKATGYEMLDYYHKVKNFGLDSYEVLSKKDCSKCRYAYGGCPYKDICNDTSKILNTPKLYSMPRETEMIMPQKTVHEVLSLADMMHVAREHFKKQNVQNKFDLRDLIADSIVTGVKKLGATAVTIPQLLLNGTDPDYMPVITRIRESQIKIFIEIT